MPSKIEYLAKYGNGELWLPMTGCTDELPCFPRCWARRMCNNWAKNPIHSDEAREKYRKSFTVGPQLWPEKLDQPLHWKKPRVIGVGFMGDLFHDDVPFGFVARVWRTMFQCSPNNFTLCEGTTTHYPEHTFLVLTKRPERMAAFVDWYYENGDGTAGLSHIYLGVSVEDQNDERISTLLSIPAAKRWVSIEPMRAGAGVDLTEIRNSEEGADIITNALTGVWECTNTDSINNSVGLDDTDHKLDWVVVGSESGGKRRPCKIEAIESIIDQCTAASVPLFIKQAEVDGKLVKMPTIRGRVWDQTPWDKDKLITGSGGGDKPTPN